MWPEVYVNSLFKRPRTRFRENRTSNISFTLSGNHCITISIFNYFWQTGLQTGIFLEYPQRFTALLFYCQLPATSLPF